MELPGINFKASWFTLLHSFFYFSLKDKKIRSLSSPSFLYDILCCLILYRKTMDSFGGADSVYSWSLSSSSLKHLLSVNLTSFKSFWSWLNHVLSCSLSSANSSSSSFLHQSSPNCTAHVKSPNPYNFNISSVPSRNHLCLFTQQSIHWWLHECVFTSLTFGSFSSIQYSVPPSGILKSISSNCVLVGLSPVSQQDFNRSSETAGIVQCDRWWAHKINWEQGIEGQEIHFLVGQ